MTNNLISNMLNSSVTQNGDLAYKSTQSSVLDIFATGGVTPPSNEKILNAFEEDLATTIKVILYLRDARFGQGNRDILESLTENLLNKDINLLKALIPYYPLIGSWKDIFKVMQKHTCLHKDIMDLIQVALQDPNQNKLLSKWLPRKGDLAKIIKSHLGLTNKEYRHQILSISETVEQKVSQGNFDDIIYSQVPSLAMKRHLRTFLKFNNQRFNLYLEDVNNKKDKINTSVLYPYEILNRIRRILDELRYENDTKSLEEELNGLNTMWENLPDFFTTQKTILPIIDVSGSMQTEVRRNVEAIDVAVSLGIYCAERNKNDFKDIWVNFSTEPDFLKLKGSNVTEKYQSLDFQNWGMTTNLEKVFEKLLNFSTKSEDFPEYILIISDMQFNEAIDEKSTLESIKVKFKERNVKIPKLVFWQVNVIPEAFPLTKNEDGSVIISGFSPSIIKLFSELNFENFNPWDFMITTLGERYNFVDELIKDNNEK